MRWKLPRVFGNKRGRNQRRLIPKLMRLGSPFRQEKMPTRTISQLARNKWPESV